MSSRTAVAVVLAVSLPLPIQAHDIYSHLRDAGGGSCCDDTDCRPALHRVTASGVQMFVDQRWIDVPSSTINTAPCPEIRARPTEGIGADQPMNQTSATLVPYT